MSAKGSAKIECSHLIISNVVRVLDRMPGIGRYGSVYLRGEGEKPDCLRSAGKAFRASPCTGIARNGHAWVSELYLLCREINHDSGERREIEIQQELQVWLGFSCAWDL